MAGGVRTEGNNNNNNAGFFGGLFGAEQPQANGSAAQMNGKESEFLVISRDFVADLEAFTAKYPLIAAIATIALGFFGLMNVLSFSPTNIITGIFLGTLCIALGKSIFNVHGRHIFSRVWTAFFRAFSNAEPAPADSKASKKTEQSNT